VVIGIVENYISKHCIEVWFYRKEESRWIRIGKERMHPKHKKHHYRKLLQKATFEVIGVGT
jgi:hypothetical protein